VLSQGNRAVPRPFLSSSPAFTTSVKSSQAPKATRLSSRHTGVKTEFNVKRSFRVTQGHLFLGTAKPVRDILQYIQYNKLGLIYKDSAVLENFQFAISPQRFIRSSSYLVLE